MQTEEFFDGLDNNQLDIIFNICSKAYDTESGILEPKQIKEILPVEQWLNYSYFLGPFAKSLYPYWKRYLPVYLNSGKPELIITGSIGGGKSTASIVACIRKLYELSCYDYPQRLFNLSDSTSIFFAYLSINLTHAERTGYGQIRSMIDSIPYFQKEFKRDRLLKTILKFPKDIYIIPGSDNLSVLSTNLYGCIMDEADFYRRGTNIHIGDANKASKIYKEVTDRRTSRFLVNGKDHGFSAIISSASFQSSFVSTRIKKALSDNSATVFSAKLWDTKPDNYSTKRFFVFSGTDKYDACIIDDIKDLDVILPDSLRPVVNKCCVDSIDSSKEELISRVMSLLPSGFKENFVEVPVDFIRLFRDDIYSSLRNIGGVAVASTGKLFTSESVWFNNVVSGLRHPFTKDSFIVSVKGKEHIIDYFLPNLLFEKMSGGEYFGLKRHPESLRYAHVDYSKNTCRTGISIVHISHYIEDSNTLVKVPYIEIDFILAIEPPKKPDSISFPKIRRFFFDLIAMGMKFKKITFDQYQSEDTIQIFTSSGIDASRVSFGLSDSPYLQVIECLYENRLNYYNYPPLKKEFFNLLWDQDKHEVDHLEELEDGSPGYKDISDSWVCAVDCCIKNSDFSNIDRKNAMDNAIVFNKSLKNDSIEDDWIFGDYKLKNKVNNVSIIGDELGKILL
jgi:hypothetical protein